MSPLNVGAPLGNDWAVASYNYAASGSSHETLTRATNLNEDVTGPNSVYWSNITTTLEKKRCQDPFYIRGR